MAAIQELVALGERMGLQGDSLNEFVKEQQAIAREERYKEKEDKEKQREFELKKLELEIKKIESAHSVEGSVHGDNERDEDDVDDEEVEVRIPHSRTAVKGPKMPPFDEKDDMDSYLYRFERYAVLQGWSKGVWAIYLAALLKGKALDVYARLPAEQLRIIQYLSLHC